MASWKIEGISKHPSYHGVVNSTKAMQRLKSFGGNCYLTRYSEERKEFTLSVYKPKEEDHEGKETESELFKNFNIFITKQEDEISYEVSGTDKTFKSIAELLNHYKGSHLTPHIQSIGVERVKDSEFLILNCRVYNS